MDKLSLEYIMTTSFRTSIDREELLVRKCKDYYKDIKAEELKEFIHDMENNSEEHIKMLKDKMVKLNIVY
jgi:hypothetical protein